MSCVRAGTSSQGTQVYAIKQSVQVMSTYIMKFLHDARGKCGDSIIAVKNPT